MVAVVAICVALIVAATVAVSMIRGEARDAALTQTASDANLTAQNVTQSVAGLQDVVAAWSKRPEVSAIAALSKNGAVAPPWALQGSRLMQGLQLARSGIATAFMVDASGRSLVNAPVNKAALGQDFSDREWFRAVVRTGAPHLTSAYRSVNPGHPWVVAASAPVFTGSSGDAGRRLVGVIVATYPLGVLQAFADTSTAGRSESLEVVDARGQVLARSGHPAGGAALARDRVVARLETGPARIEGSEAGFRGGSFAAVSGVGSSGWSVVARKSASAALAPTERIVAIIRVMALLVMLTIVVGSLLWAGISRRRRMTLMLARERFHAVYNISPVGIVEMDLRQMILHCNTAFATMVDRAESEIVGRYGYEFLHRDSQPPDFDGLAEFVAGRTDSHSSERLLVSKDGAALPVVLAWALTNDPRGAAIGLACVVTDISAQVRARTELQEARNRAEVLWEQAPIGVLTATPDGMIASINPSLERLLGHRAEDVIGTDVERLADPSDLASMRAARRQLAEGHTHHAEPAYLASNGTLVPVHVSSAILYDAGGEIDRFAAFFLDLSEIRAQQAAAERSAAELAEANAELARRQRFTDALLETVEVGIISCDAAGNTVLRNRAERALIGRDTGDDGSDPEQSPHLDALDMAGNPIPVEDYPIMRTLRGEQIGEYHMLLGPAGGPHREVVVRGNRITGPDGEVYGAVISLHDVTTERVASRALALEHRKLAEAQVELLVATEAAERANAFFDAVLTATPDYTFVTDLATGAVTYGSRGKEVLGITSAQLEGLGSQVIAALIHPDDQVRIRAANVAARDLEDRQVLQVRYRAMHADGQWRWLNRRVTAFRRDDSGQVTEVLGVVRDVTDIVQAEDKLTHAALHDHLTGLPNRALLVDRLDAALSRSARDRREIAVLFCDLDGFKRVNDTAGHAAGDAVLIETARRLAGVVREHDTVARVGGDEFVIVVEPWNRGESDLQLSSEQDRALAVRVANRITEVLREPIAFEGVEHVVSASIGITHAVLSPAGRSGSLTADEVLQDADTAMYRAKTRGKDRFEVFEHGLRTDLAERGRIEQLLRSALRTAAAPPDLIPRQGAPLLTAAYQPIFDSRTGALAGFEALARLVDSEGQEIPPVVFISIAEETGLIHQLGRVILDLACGQLATWRESYPGMAGVTMAVNVSAVQAQHACLGDEVRAALASHGLGPADLVLELTETVLLRAAHSTITALHSLRTAGVGIAIDDFGIGYASLRYLATMPVSAVKVDKSFTAGLPADATSRKIISAVAGLADDMGLECIVEGVETEAQRDALPAGVYLQGYLTGRPQRPAGLDLTGLLSSLQLP